MPLTSVKRVRRTTPFSARVHRRPRAEKTLADVREETPVAVLVREREQIRRHAEQQRSGGAQRLDAAEEAAGRELLDELARELERAAGSTIRLDSSNVRRLSSSYRCGFDDEVVAQPVLAEERDHLGRDHALELDLGRLIGPAGDPPRVVRHALAEARLRLPRPKTSPKIFSIRSLPPADVEQEPIAVVLIADAVEAVREAERRAVEPARRRCAARRRACRNSAGVADAGHSVNPFAMNSAGVIVRSARRTLDPGMLARPARCRGGWRSPRTARA